MSRIMVIGVVIAALAIVVGLLALANIEQRRDRRRQPPVEMPEWLQGLTRTELRMLLQAKQYKTQAELRAMADSMRALNRAQHRSSLADTPATSFDDDGLEMA